jgi:mannose-1-phosphate guanylyltransferase
LSYHYRKSSPGTVVLYKAPDMADTPPVGIDGERVIDFKNFLNTGSASGLLYTGLAVLSPSLLPYLVHEFSSIVYTGFIELIRGQSLYFYEHKGIWLDIGSLRSYWNANMLLRENAGIFDKRMLSSCGLELYDIAKDVSVDTGAKINGSIIGDNCVIGDGADIRSSVLLPGSRIDAKMKVQDSVVYRNNRLLID